MIKAETEKGAVRLTMSGENKDIIDEYIMITAQVLKIAKCRDRGKLMNIGINLVNNAVDILFEQEKEKAESDSV